MVKASGYDLFRVSWISWAEMARLYWWFRRYLFHRIFRMALWC